MKIYTLWKRHARRAEIGLLRRWVVLLRDKTDQRKGEKDFRYPEEKIRFRAQLDGQKFDQVVVQKIL